MEPLVCTYCSNKLCESSELFKLDICKYGVAFYISKNGIEKKEEKITVRDISNNLRHELHKILQIIVSEANKIDPLLSSKKIDLKNPASRIVGATKILDQFIEMIAGVHDFHPSDNLSANLHKKTNL